MSEPKQKLQTVCKPVENPPQDRALRSPVERRPARTADILPPASKLEIGNRKLKM